MNSKEAVAQRIQNLCAERGIAVNAPGQLLWNAPNYHLQYAWRKK